MLAASASAKAPAGRYTVAALTVFDNLTKLTWQRTPFNGTKPLKGAHGYCKSLSLDKGGWRLPTVKELLTLVDLSTSNPSIDVAAFPNTPNDYFWTATVYAPSSGYAWIVTFHYGTATYLDVYSTGRVRCVR